MASIRTYSVNDSVWFRSSFEDNFYLSNFYRNAPISWNDFRFANSEAVYQAMKYPLDIEYVGRLAASASPRDAKWFAHQRPAPEGWSIKRIDAMRDTLQLKFAQNDELRMKLVRTGDRPIVEWSERDDFWGAVKLQNKFVGVNCLGRLLMELRESL